MTSTLNNSKLTVRIIEDISINNRDRGNTTTYEIGGINELSERIMTVPTNTVTILSASDKVGAGTFLSSSLKYIRLTNLDDTNFVRLSFISGSSGLANTADLKLDSGKTMIFTNTSFSGSHDKRSFDSFSGFTALKGTADTASVDLEIFIAST